MSTVRGDGSPQGRNVKVLSLQGWVRVSLKSHARDFCRHQEKQPSAPLRSNLYTKSYPSGGVFRNFPAQEPTVDFITNLRGKLPEFTHISPRYSNTNLGAAVKGLYRCY